MLIELKKKFLINSSIYLMFILIILISFFFIILFNSILTIKNLNISNIKPNQSILLKTKKSFETRIKCIGPLYNQSCLYRNLYYVNSTFIILTVKGRKLPNFTVRTESSMLFDVTPSTRIFDSYSDLEIFVRTVINPQVFPSVSVYFGQAWHTNIGHALFDGLYPIYVALIRFSPRHLKPFRIIADLDPCNDCWSEDIYSRFAGLGLIKQRILNEISKLKWFMFDELLMGSGNSCQRCTQPNFQLPAGIELDASRLFRNRIYQQHGLIPSIIRQKSSSEYRNSRDILSAYIIDNKRFTDQDRRELIDALHFINNYTYFNLNKTILKWPLINVTFINYYQIKSKSINITQINETSIDSRSLFYELIDNQFIAQLKLIREIDIHVSGPGTAQMYQTFLSDGSVHINLGGIRPLGLENTKQAYTSYLEQYMTSGTPYIKGLYYPINQRINGIKKNEIIKLIRYAAKIILQGFHLPVNSQENLAIDGKLFVEMCQKDKEFCSLVTKRFVNSHVECLNLWIEDFVHEQRQWKLGGFFYGGQLNISCSFNRTLLKQLRYKYNIQHYEDYSN